MLNWLKRKVARRRTHKAHDEDGGVAVWTWIGTPGSAKQSQVLEEINRNTPAVHFVVLESLKTYPVKVTVRGSIESNEPKLRFEGGSYVTSYAWSEPVTLRDERRCLNDVYVKRRKVGDEVVYLRWQVNDGFPSPAEADDPILEIAVTVK